MRSKEVEVYKVIESFMDLQDDDFVYSVGDTFPRKGMKVSVARYEELAGSHNKRGMPLIEKVEPKKAKSKKE